MCVDVSYWQKKKKTKIIIVIHFVSSRYGRPVDLKISMKEKNHAHTRTCIHSHQIAIANDIILIIINSIERQEKNTQT